MNLLVLNGHGLGNPCTERELGEIIWAKDPSVVFIAKTWADQARLITVMCNFDYKHKWIVPKERKGGGLALF